MPPSDGADGAPRQRPLGFAPAELKAVGYSDAHVRPLVSRQLPTTFRVHPSLAWDFPHIELRAANSYPALILDCDNVKAALDALVLPPGLASGPNTA